MRNAADHPSIRLLPKKFGPKGYEIRTLDRYSDEEFMEFCAENPDLRIEMDKTGKLIIILTTKGISVLCLKQASRRCMAHSPVAQLLFHNLYAFSVQPSYVRSGLQPFKCHLRYAAFDGI